MDKRKIFSKLLKYSGVLYGLRRFGDNRSLRILMYHRVFDEEDDFPYYLDGVPIASFETQTEFLARCCSVVLLEETVERMKSGKALPKNAVAITVDDGYKDCYDNIYPVLRKYGLPATIFLTTNNIGSSELFWVDKVGYLFKRGYPVSAVYEHPRFSKIEVDSSEKRMMNLEYVIEKLKAVSEEEKNEVIDDLQNFFQVKDGELRVDYNLTWDEVREMSNNGISFGAHTVTHPILTRVSLEIAEREIKESKERIEAEIGKQIYGFCYPNGQNGDFDDSIIEILKRYDFKYAVTTKWGFNDANSDLFRLKRFGPNADDGMAEFECMVSGGFEVGRKIREIGLARMGSALPRAFRPRSLRRRCVGSQ